MIIIFYAYVLQAGKELLAVHGDELLMLAIPKLFFGLFLRPVFNRLFLSNRLVNYDPAQLLMVFKRIRMHFDHLTIFFDLDKFAHDNYSVGAGI